MYATVVFGNVQKQFSLKDDKCWLWIISDKNYVGMFCVRSGLLKWLCYGEGLYLIIKMNLPFRPRLLWVDMEMSGLEPRYHRILEFACILTDDSLQYQQEGPHIIVHCDQDHLLTMDQWNTTHHTQSGLIKSCIESNVSIQQAQEMILNYLQQLGIKKGELMIAGNSVHMDKLFLFHQMPRLDEFLHYRILDVTSVKTVVNAKNPSLFFMKKSTHRALDDIRESIGELEFYMKKAFK